MDESLKISVIVPLYNVEKYLSNCLDSIVNQTYKNLEIILIDDGATDNCPKICDEYALSDNRIKVIHKENGGLSSARNAGLDIATGDYIAFVDSDDWLNTCIYESLIKVAKDTNSDVVSCYPIFVVDGKIDNKSYSGEVKTINDKQEIFSLLASSRLRFEVWNKLFKKDVIDNTRFILGRIYEDLRFEFSVFSKVNSLSIVDIGGYYYRFNRPGSTNSYFKDNRFSYFEDMNHYIEYFENLGWTNLKKKYLRTAAENCITFYMTALSLRATNEQKKRLRTIYDGYYHKMKEVECRIGVKHILFKFSPTFYGFVFRLKNKQ